MRAGNAIVPAIFDDLIGRAEPVLFGNDPHEILFYLFRRFFIRKTEDSSKTLDVRVDGDPLDDAIRVAQNDIRRLPANSRNRYHFRHRPGQFSMIVLFDDLRRRENVPCLGAVETALLDVALKLARFCHDIIRKRAILFKKPWRYLVHFFIRTLRREFNGD